MAGLKISWFNLDLLISAMSFVNLSHNGIFDFSNLFSRYNFLQSARLSFPLDVFGIVLGKTKMTSSGGIPIASLILLVILDLISCFLLSSYSDVSATIKNFRLRLLTSSRKAAVKGVGSADKRQMRQRLGKIA